MKTNQKSGFTLIELIMVIVVLAIISSLAISKFVDLKEKSAKRVNISSIQNLQRAVETYIVSADQQYGNFSRVDALLDVGPSGAWTGSAGTYDFSDTKKAIGSGGIPGIYRGPKSVTRIENANGEASVDSGTESLDTQREQNQGIPSTLVNKIGIYYLTATDAEMLRKAGVSSYLLHNYTAGQASALGFTAGNDNLPLVNGGPGFRADMSPFYPAILTNGSPVVVLNPATSLSTFKAFGCDPELNYDTMQQVNSRTSDKAALGEQLYADQKVTTRLFCFGLGSACAFAQKALDTVPRSEVYGREYYRQYILVFKQTTTAQSGMKVSFAGVIDPDGNSVSDARFQADWR